MQNERWDVITRSCTTADFKDTVYDCRHYREESCNLVALILSWDICEPWICLKQLVNAGHSLRRIHHMLVCYSPLSCSNYKTQNNSHYHREVKTGLTFMLFIPLFWVVRNGNPVLWFMYCIIFYVFKFLFPYTISIQTKFYFGLYDKLCSRRNHKNKSELS